MEDQNSGRRRQHPQERFAAPQHPYDLAEAAKALRQEAQAGEGGHRQQSLYKHGPTSVSLFAFDRLTRLAPHRTRGVVSIHLLRGHLRIMAEGKSHDLYSGHLLVLAPGVQHDVVAQEESEMLLTVHLDAADAQPFA
jgi:quercetin dioxygenase-like cupin family protein